MPSAREALSRFAQEATPITWNFDLLPAQKPVLLDEDQAKRAAARPQDCSDFFKACLEVYEAVLANELPPIVGTMLFADLPPGQGLDFHRQLGPRSLTVPQCFRTDEAVNGKVLEIQAPGSIWGEYLLLSDYFAGQADSAQSQTAVRSFTRGLTEFVGNSNPAVLYLTDAASAQSGVRYFIHRTMASGIRYYGWDQSVKVSQIDHIRGHSFQSLVAENLFKIHSQSTDPGLYDLPLNAIFDSKVLLPLPFWYHTREFFEDSSRSLLAPTSFLEPEGVHLPDGSFLRREEFLNLKPGQRHWYLKYSGGDLSRNWGSRAVHRLRTRGGAWRRVIEAAWEEADRGSAWTLQTEISETVSSADLLDDESEPVDLHPKYSSLCCYGELFGGIAMFSAGIKTHGQHDTVIAPMVPPAA